MADKNDELERSLDRMLKTFEKTNDAMDRVSKKFSKATEQLSDAGVDKFVKDLKAAAKSTGMLNDKQLENIKTMGQLEQAVDLLEEKYQQSEKIEAKRAAENAKAAKIEMKDARAASEIRRHATNDYRQSMEILRQSHNDLTVEQVKAVKAFREQSTGIVKGIGVYDKLNKGMQDFGTSVKGQISSFATLSTAIGFFKKALVGSYEQMTRLTGRGMLGAFNTINLMAPKLLLSAQEFEEIINKNRDIVNQMGGGVEGVEKFGEEISKARDGLQILGKDASKAAARFMETTKAFGLTPKDGKAYQIALNKTKENFKKVSSTFGDSYEEYANLVDAQSQDANYQSRLNGLSKERIALESDELQKRTMNLKLMGLSNAQIVEFNNKIEALYNPHKNTQVQRRTEAVSARVMNQQQMNLLAQNPENAGTVQSLQDTQGSFEKATQLHAAGRVDALKELLASPEGQKMILAQAAAKSAIGAGVSNGSINDLATFGTNASRERSGGFDSLLSSTGSAMQNADAQGRNLLKNGEAQAAQLVQKNLNALGAEATALGESFKKAAIAVEGVNAIMNNNYGQALLGVVAGFLAITNAGNLLKNAIGMMTSSAGGAATIMRTIFTGLFTFLKKIPVLSAIYGGMKGAYEGFNTSTGDYRKRLGMDENESSLLGDTWARTAGVFSDVGAGTVQAGSFGMYDPSKNFADKQAKAAASTASSMPSPGPGSAQAPKAIGAPDFNKVKGYKSASSDVQSAIQMAAQKTGVDPMLLATMASQESSFNPTAKASTSSATGLFQFTDSTWMDTIKKNGSKYGIDTTNMSKAAILNLRNDPNISALMGAELLKANQAATGSNSAGGAYLAHFLGAGAASKVLNANPNTPIDNLVSQQQINANAGVFGNVKTAGDLQNWAQNSMNNRSGGQLNTSAVTSAVAGAGNASTVSEDTPEQKELKKQTAILAAIANNTREAGPSAQPDSYKGDPATIYDSGYIG